MKDSDIYHSFWTEALPTGYNIMFWFSISHQTKCPEKDEQ